MKLSLRNIALAGVLSLAGAAMAQDAPAPAPFTLSLDWKQDVSITNTNARFGAGADGKVFIANRADGKVMVADANGVRDYIAIAGMGQDIAADDAGNLVVGMGWAGAGSGQNFTLVKASDLSTSTVSLVLPDGFAAARTDQIGRITGDIFSEQGGIMYLTENAATKVLMVYFKNGEQDTETFGFYDSEGVDAKYPLNTSTVAQPFYDIATLLDMGDDAASQGFVYRNRGSQNVVQYDGSGWIAWTKPAGATSSEGFDIFSMGDVNYQVQPIKITNNYSSVFAIADQDGNIVTRDSNLIADQSNNAQSFGSYNVRKVDDNTFEIYQYFAGPAKVFAAKFTVSKAGDTPQPPTVNPLYMAGSTQGWDPANATEVPVVDGKYVINFTEADAAAQFKLSTVKGDWTAFNAACMGLAEDNQSYTLVPDQAETLQAGKAGNIALPSAGTWTVTIDPSNWGLVLTGTAAAPSTEVPDVYVRGALTSWNIDPAFKFASNGETTDNGEMVLTLELNTLPAGEFKVSGPESDWSGINLGAGADKDITSAGADWNNTFQLYNNGQNFNVTADITPCTLTLYYNAAGTSWLKVSQSTGVNSIEAANNEVATYYNLQGVRVANPAAGNLYIKTVNGKASKVLVK